MPERSNEKGISQQTFPFQQEVDEYVFDVEVTAAVAAKVTAARDAANGIPEKRHPDEKHDIPRPVRPRYTAP